MPLNIVLGIFKDLTTWRSERIFQISRFFSVGQLVFHIYSLFFKSAKISKKNVNQCIFDLVTLIHPLTSCVLTDLTSKNSPFLSSFLHKRRRSKVIVWKISPFWLSIHCIHYWLLDYLLFHGLLAFIYRPKWLLQSESKLLPLPLHANVLHGKCRN